MLCALLLHSTTLFFFTVFLLQRNHNSGTDVLHPRVSVTSQPFRLLGVPAPLIPPPQPPLFNFFFYIIEGLEEVFLESFVNFEQTPYLPRLRTGSLGWNTSHEIPLRGLYLGNFGPLERFYYWQDIRCSFHTQFQNISKTVLNQAQIILPLFPLFFFSKSRCERLCCRSQGTER